MPNNEEFHLEVYSNRSILVYEDGNTIVFMEGPSSRQAQERLRKVKEELRGGFLEHRIQACKGGKIITIENEVQKSLLDSLVNAVTSEVGRALIGLTILQCCIKAIEPNQSVRLHKASKSSTSFSWKEGIPMRSIDKELITPVLRRYDLLHLNADGFMMTRSLAENYPYSRVYKAALRGGREQWLAIIDLIEKAELPASTALDYIIALLVNKSADFNRLADQTLNSVHQFLDKGVNFDEVYKVITQFISKTSYSARVFEVAMHSLLQAVKELNSLDGSLKPLTQMRSANKKHGNIGDVEVLEAPNSPEILEAWDAKYGKPYLRDELEELGEKLTYHPETRFVGFVVDKNIDLRQDILERRDDLQQLYDVKIELLNFDEWVKIICGRTVIDCDLLGREWLVAFTESLCQRRRIIAPIDEPSYEWVRYLGEIIKSQ